MGKIYVIFITPVKRIILESKLEMCKWSIFQFPFLKHENKSENNF